MENQFKPFMDAIGRYETIIKRQESIIRDLTDFRERVENIIYKTPELDEHGNSKPYRYDNLITELRAACNQEEGPVWEAPWRVVK